LNPARRTIILTARKLKLRIGDIMRAKLYIYPYRIADRKPHAILWSFDREALNEIAKNFRNKSVFNVEIEKKMIILRLAEVPTPWS